MAQQDCYGIHYSMYINDIVSIEEVTILEVNDKLKTGYILLAIVQYGDEGGSEPAYCMGKPRDLE